MVLTVTVRALAAQTNAPPKAAAGGEGDVAFQGYYLAGSQQPFLNTTGTAVHFREFLPGIGFLSGSLEGYGSQNRFQTGENFLELRGLPWAGQYWTFTGGDFRAPASLVEFPFNNIFTPEIDGRGVRVQATHGETQYTYFWGQETLTAGPRVPYRFLAPQTVMGTTATRKMARGLTVGARLMQFSASPQAIRQNAYLFPLGRDVGTVRTVAMQANYTPTKQLKFYAEGSRPISGSGSRLTSYLAGVNWQGARFTVRANYTYQGILYFPLAGYFAGDRRGPFVETRFRLGKGMELFATASRYGNNLERDRRAPFLESKAASAGISALLPGKVAISGQVSTVRYSSQAPGQEAVASQNRQITGDASRAFGRQTVHLSWREIVLDTPPQPQRQRSTEVGDAYQFKHISVGGAVRYQQSTGSERLNSLFFRGLAQVSAGPVNLYANLDIGNDLANATVFSTEAYQTSVVGASLRLPRRWNLQAEMFRNRLNLALNQENVFLLQNGEALAGVSPTAAVLSTSSQWSFFFRISKQFRLGVGLPAENAVAGLPRSGLSLTGTIEGMVRLRTLAANMPAAAIAIAVDGGRTVLSGADGHYLLEGVPEGVHEVGLALDQLPADFDPGDVARNMVAVQSHHSVRADFDVLPLLSISDEWPDRRMRRSTDRHPHAPRGALCQHAARRIFHDVQCARGRLRNGDRSAKPAGRCGTAVAGGGPGIAADGKTAAARRVHISRETRSETNSKSIRSSGSRAIAVPRARQAIARDVCCL
ncbi:MAG: hypothetical protein WDO73_06910 [Ignavibacteriota bacterium]